MEGSNFERVIRVGKNLVYNPNLIPAYLSKSLLNKKEPLDLELPWLSFSSINFLKGYLNKKEHDVLELGGGGSTIFFSKYAKSVKCLESFELWASKINNKIKSLDLSNVSMEIHPYVLYSSEDFIQSNYFKSISKGKFDVILIDNYEEELQLRPFCFYEAEKIVKEGGIIIVDDSWRYKDLRIKNSAKSHIIFQSVGPARLGVTSTDIYFY